MLHAGLAKKHRWCQTPAACCDRTGMSCVKLSQRLNELRYTTDPQWDQKLATTVLHQLRDPPDGVLPWLSKHITQDAVRASLGLIKHFAMQQGWKHG